MNNDRIKGQWKQVRGKLKSNWGKLTSDDITTVEGDTEYLVGKLQQRYGVTRDEARRQVDEFSAHL